MMICRNSFCCQFSSLSLGTSQSHQVKKTEVEVLLMGFKLSNCTLFTTTSSTILTTKATMNSQVKCSVNQSGQLITNSKAVERKMINKAGKREHHLWKRRDSAGSGQKALNLVRIVSGLPNEKESVYGALDKWTAWETEFPLIAAAKALRILRKRSQWKRVIQVAKWMLSKGQGATMGTYDTLLLAFDMDQRVDEAESLWNMILHVFADMEELGVKPDQDTVRRVARAFQKLGQEEKQMLVLKRYQSKWKYVHFKGERVRVRTDVYNEDNA
ncbi:pentatricopeptide repeat-containing protein At4g18975, chloroplastic isoform X3 [Quercus robur]|uniref:pentatricopeptide repeat-containing protein At4g18975, chloroplastic isoform X3 n=1 Tax=Quercus robur TaxID=38942 RepID=UPI002163D2B0|nr:pentatricopeptide repeat-containing protein At4g18975, chloroplastic isoform X3 [Quercus robur]